MTKEAKEWVSDNVNAIGARPLGCRSNLLNDRLRLVSRISRGKTAALFLAFALAAPAALCGAGVPHAGPLFDRFDLTLDSGHRTEIAGPLFYSQNRETEKIWAVPPLLSYTRDPGTESIEFDFVYPLATYDRYGGQYRWQFFQLFSVGGGPTQQESARNRFTIFPFYFQQRSSVPEENYTALIPFYGHLKNRLFRDEVFFVMLPFYVQSRKRDVVTDNYVYPFFHLRHGEGLQGWQFWPLLGREHKDVTTRTNGFGETETVGGHDKFFVLWPFFANQTGGIGTEDKIWQQELLPAYSLYRSTNRDVTTILWPFFSRIDEREKKYREWQAPWPFIVIARGEGKSTTRFLPLFSRAHTAEIESDFYLWPVYKYKRIHSDPLDQQRTRILFFLYSDTIAKNTETGATKRRTDLWPLFTHQRDFHGNTRLQVLAVLEPYLPGSRKIERDYSPVCSIWRSEKNAQTGTASQSLLWNLYRRETAPASKRCSFLFGLFQYGSDTESRQVRLFYIPIVNKAASN